MCSFAVRIQKLCQVAAEAEFELMMSLAPLWHHRNAGGSISRSEIGGARRQLVLRGDAWALSAFNRVMDFLKEHPEVCEQLATRDIDAEPQLREGAVQAYLDHVERPGYPEALVCQEASDLMHDLERATSD